MLSHNSSECLQRLLPGLRRQTQPKSRLSCKNLPGAREKKGAWLPSRIVDLLAWTDGTSPPIPRVARVPPHRLWTDSRTSDKPGYRWPCVFYVWTLCTGFELGGYLYLNDAFSEDGAQEYAVVKRPSEADPVFRQVESITFSWCRLDEALHYIQDTISGKDDGPEKPEVTPLIEPYRSHSYCALCA